MTDQEPLVSILVITYNQADILVETIESCLAQTYSNVEIVVSDDASTDATPEILRKMQRDNPDRVRLVLNSVNGGITANSNAGLEACRGEYVAYMGGDDLLLPGKVAAQVAAFESNPDLVLSYHPCYVMRDGEIHETVGDRPKDIVENLHDMIANFGAQMPGPAAMFRATALPATGFDSAIRTASDWMFFIDVSSHGQVARIDEPLGIYRLHEGNVGNRYFSYSEDFIKTLDSAEARYGDRPGVTAAVRSGGKRYLLGVIYRAIEQGEPVIAREFAKQLGRYSSTGLATAVALLTWVPGTSAVLRAAKARVKRYV